MQEGPPLAGLRLLRARWWFFGVHFLPGRHSREGWLRFTSAEPNIQRLQRHLSRTSFPRTRAPLYFDGAEHPEASAPSLKNVIPANAGIQCLSCENA
ncbi:hypothetical protein [Lysobacter gummosus]|uniref:hypothetical protein n=1 Tax=Lysobacter gummosus TaxID=262324 RepID=UPI0036361DAA